MRGILALFACLVLVAAAPALIGSEAVRITLKAHVEVNGPIATVADVADLSGDQDLIDRLSALTVLELPGLGVHRLTAAQVRTAVAAVVPGRSLAVTGECLLARRSQVVRADEMVAAAVAAATADTSSETVAVPLKDGGAVIVPGDAAEVRVVADALDTRASGDIPFRVRVMRGDTELARSLVTLTVTRYRTVVVAAHQIHAGDIIVGADFTTARMAMDAVNRYALSQGDGLIGESARIDIAEGTPLVAGLVRPHLDVHGGAVVSLVYSSVGVLVTATGEALSDGKIGDVVSVRRGIDGQCVKGRISAPGEVHVNY